VKEAIGLCLDEKNEKAPKMQLVGVQRIAVWRNSPSSTGKILLKKK
jgi:hypothetical protein